ncbi:MAG TPA: type II secretion system minor pseudopilin GspK, partial [Burkholderiaceae bacterium]
MRQRGAALLTAMVVVALVTSLAAAMVWRQSRAIAVEAAERSRTQSEWMLLGALDWSRLILREDARANQSGSAPIDHLGEVWAVPLAETRLSTFLAAEGDGVADADDDGPEAFLSGTITDAQSFYNLNNLRKGAGTQPPPAELRTFERLCEQAGCPGGSARDLAIQLRAAFAARSGTSGVDSTPLVPTT